MKRTLIIVIAMASIAFSSCRKNSPALDGYWQGTIMGQFTVILDIKVIDEQLGGRIYAYDGELLFQDDTIQDITLKGDSVFFFIPAKETHFAGFLSENLFDGNLLFEDGGMTPAIFHRKSQVELAEAGLLPNVLPSVEVLNERFGLEKLKVDYDQFAELLRKSHPGLYAYQSESDFESSVARIRLKIKDRMSTREFVPVLMELSASIGCSHTRVRPSRKVRMAMESHTAMLPIQFRMTNGKLYVEDDLDHQISIRGTEVLSINGVLIAETVSGLMSIIPAEAFYSKAKEYEFNRYQTSYLPFILTDSTFEIKGLKDGNEMQVSPTKVKVSELPWRSPEYNPQWTLRNIRSRNAALLSIPTFAFPEPLEAPHWLDSVFNSIEEEGVGTLIIDLRGNEGGPPYPARILLSYLIDRPFAYFSSSKGLPEEVADLAPLYQTIPESPKRFKGKLIVLSDAGVMSTAGHFLSIIRYFKAGRIAGQPPASHMACNDNTYEVVLSNTNIECSIPRTRFTTNISGMDPRQILQPDILFECCTGILSEDSDPLMDYLLDKVIK